MGREMSSTLTCGILTAVIVGHQSGPSPLAVIRHQSPQDNIISLRNRLLVGGGCVCFAVAVIFVFFPVHQNYETTNTIANYDQFLVRDSMLSALYAIARPSVSPSVCHTGGSVKNG